MHILELQVPVELFQPRTAEPRSTGLHVSHVIRDIDNKVINVGKRGPAVTPAELARMGPYVLGGFAWEEIIRDALVRMYPASNPDRFQPAGELKLDGLIGSPDWLDMEEWVLEEFKSTWKSSRGGVTPDRFWSWFVQIQAYCKMLKVLRANLRVFFVNGDYRSSGPQVKMYRLEFEQAELDQNWEMLVKHAKEMGWL
jgi:hypothetical protein